MHEMPKKLRLPPKSSKPSESNGSQSTKEVTIIWGEIVEAEDYIKVPRALLRLPRYQTQYKLKPRHVLLLLSLASRKFKKKTIRVYWEELAEDLGVNKDSVRKWAYELRNWGLLRIAQHRGRDPDKNRVGHRNERNSFDLSPFVEVVDKAYRLRRKDRGKDVG